MVPRCRTAARAASGFRRAGGRQRAIARGAAALAGAPAAAGRRACEAAGPAAIGVHAEPLRGLHVAGGQRADRAQRIDGPRASVPGDSQVAGAARPKRHRASAGAAEGENAVSILDRMTRTGVISTTTTSRRDLDVGSCGRPVRVDPHLDTCAECRVRYAAFDAWLRRDRATTLTPKRTSAFPPSAWRRSRRRSPPPRSARAPRAGHRVPEGRRGADSAAVAVRRWVAVAAAAGLIAGVGLGQIVDLRHAGTCAHRPAEHGRQQPRPRPRHVPRPCATPVAIRRGSPARRPRSGRHDPRYEALRASTT